MNSSFVENLPVHTPAALGARVHDAGVCYRVWAPDHAALSVHLRRADGREALLALTREPDGYFSGEDPQGQAGDRYAFGLEDGSMLPDPASRFQPEGVHAWSEVVDARSFAWETDSWQRPRWEGQSIYELHVGTFTREGTFRAAIARLEHLVALGVEAIELMPLADFPGQRNWGYDGVALYAPARCYGRPDDLRALIDAAHGRGLAVMLDVVYNHLGPDGNYLARFARGYFDPNRHTPWGQAFQLAGHESRPVRDFFIANAVMWLDEFRLDGLRLDATHAMWDPSPQHLLAEIAAAVHARGGFLIAEDERNVCEILRRPNGRGAQLDAIWSDDFHHQVRVALTGTQEAYFKNYRGTPADLAETLRQGWFYTGQPFASWQNRPRGEPCSHLPPSAFVCCLENHDQIGNRARGERLEHLISREAFRAASMLLLLSPYPPLLFMGQEWAASSPFLYFTDHHGELGKLVTAGRQKEFASVGLNAGVAAAQVPDPQLERTFVASKLNWDELASSEHASILALYRECLRERRGWLRSARERSRWSVTALDRGIAVRFRPREAAERLLVCSLAGKAHVDLPASAGLAPPSGSEWIVELTSHLSGVRPDDRAPVETLVFDAPTTTLLVAAPAREGDARPGESAAASGKSEGIAAPPNRPPPPRPKLRV